MKQIFAELGRLPETDLEVLRLFYKIPKQSRADVVRAVASSIAKFQSGSMPTEEDVIDSLNEDELSILQEYLESDGSDPSLIARPEHGLEGLTPLNAFFNHDVFYNALYSNHVSDEICDTEYRIIEILIEKGSDVNAKDVGYNNHEIIPVHCAASMIGSSDLRKLGARIMKLLVDHGADINVKNSDGKTAYDVIMGSIHADADDLETAGTEDEFIEESKTESVRILTELGFNPEYIVDRPTKNQVIRTLKTGDFSVLLDYLESGGDASVIASSYETKLTNPFDALLNHPMFMKSLNVYDEDGSLKNVIYRIFEILVSTKKQYINNRTEITKRTPMHFVAEMLAYTSTQDLGARIMKLLIQNGARVSAKDFEAKTPYKTAIETVNNRDLDNPEDAAVLKTQIRNIMLDLGAKIPLNKEEKAAVETIKKFRNAARPDFILPQSATSTEWQEVCRSKSKEFTDEQKQELLGTTGKLHTKREICQILAQDLEEHANAAVRDKYVRKNCPRDIDEDGTMGIDPVTYEDLNEYDPNDLLTIDGHCFSRDTMEGLMRVAENKNRIKNPYTQVLFTSAEIKKITNFLENDNAHRMVTRFKSSKPTGHVDPNIEMRRNIEAKLQNAGGYIDSVRLFKMTPAEVMRMARFVFTESGGVFTFRLGDIATKPTGLQALDLFVTEMTDQLRETAGGWIFVQDWLKKLSDEEIAAAGVPLQ